MKKIFTLFAVAAMAFTASAQETIFLAQNTAESVTAAAPMTSIWGGDPVDDADGLTWSESGITMYLVKADKAFSGGNSNSENGKPIKFSNSAPNIMIIPENFPVKKIEFYGYCNDKNTDNNTWLSNLGIEEAGAYKELYTNDGTTNFCRNMYAEKEEWGAMTLADMPKITVELENAVTGNVWFKNGGKQPCWFVKLYKGEKSGIADIVTDENAPVEYFNLQGVRVENPANGLYIKRQGSQVSKVIVK